MKEINATTTYDPACSDMQEVEYTMPQSKRDITKCLMIALDNFAEAQAEIDELEQFCINIYMSLSVSELHKVTAPVEEAWHKGQKLWLRNTKHKGE